MEMAGRLGSTVIVNWSAHAAIMETTTQMSFKRTSCQEQMDSDCLFGSIPEFSPKRTSRRLLLANVGASGSH